MLGILLAGLPGCGQSPNNKETSSSESSAADEPESEIIYINGVLTESDEDSVTMEYGSEGNFTQTTFDISNADIQIGEKPETRRTTGSESETGNWILCERRKVHCCFCIRRWKRKYDAQLDL